MTVDAPILALLLLPVVAIAFALAGRWLNRRARWLIRAAIFSAAVAIPGLNLRCERPLSIAVMVDVSPSTRGATFRDARAVAARLTPLLAGRPFTLHYFADGPVTNATEPAAERSRLEIPPGTDAVVLLSDGRFEASPDLPPIFAVVDPALDAPADARVRDLRWGKSGEAPAAAIGDRTAIVNGVGGNGSVLRFNDPTAAALRPPPGPTLVTLRTTRPTLEARFDGGDLWPENDRMSLVDAASPARRIAVGVDASGYESLEATALPTNAADYAATAGVVVATSAHVSAAQVAALRTYVSDFGGSLVLAGSPAAAPALLRAVAPLSAVPPAGPGAWVVLLDASGSMAGDDGRGGNRWSAALDAAAAAVDRLPDDARVTLMRFAGDVRTMAAGPVAAARQALASAATEGPGGRTGLRGALAAFATRAAAGTPSREPTRLLLLTDGDADLGDVDALAASLRAAQVTVDAVAPSAAVARLCAATGGRCVANAAPSDWAKVFGGLAGDAAGGGAIARAERLAGRGVLASRTVESSRRWPAWAKAGADGFAASGDAPAAAVWNSGLGRVASVAATVSADDLAAMAKAVERPSVDPRFMTTVDDRAGVVCLVAVDGSGPMNALQPQLGRGGEIIAFEQVGPGTYEAPLVRRPAPTVATIRVGDAVVGRRAIAGRYAVEFDAIGNDREALARFVERTGGGLIEAGDSRPIAFTPHWVNHPLRRPLTIVASVLMVWAVFAIRGRSDAEC